MQRGHLHLYVHSHGSLAPIPGSRDVDGWNWNPVTLDQMENIMFDAHHITGAARDIAGKAHPKLFG